jgi:hypothetical protein
MPVCKVSTAGAPDGASSLLIGWDPAEAIGLVDGLAQRELPDDNDVSSNASTLSAYSSFIR